MDLWIIQDGDKRGPLHDFEIRRMIESGELPASTLAWHEGMDGWKPLGSISLFEREFTRPFEEPEKRFHHPQPATGSPTPPPVPDRPVFIRRFWARWFDLYVFAGVWWLALWAVGQDIGATLMNPWIILLQYVPWFVIEIILLHRFGTTPGKWLLGLHVTNDNDSLLSLAEATRRSSRVFFIGIGMGWGWLALVCQSLALFTARKFGRPIWDHAAGHRVSAAPLHPLRLSFYVILLFTAIMMQFFVLFPFVMEDAAKRNPEMREQFERLKESYQRLWEKP